MNPSELPPSPKNESRNHPPTQETDDWNRAKYGEFADAYLDSNTDGHIGGYTPSERAAYLHDLLPEGSIILEIGSGGGDDAQALKEAGYKVIPSELTPAFIKTLREKGFEPIELNAKTDPLPGNIDALFANAVFVHFSPEDLSDLLKRFSRESTKEKTIFLSLIASPSEVVEYKRTSARSGFERDFYYYPYAEVERLLKEEGFSILASREIEEASKWIQIIAQKS